ncbi:MULTISPECIES: sulfotransferase family 2 domain-containing protein [unclassified Candidatus Frackibacter]|uniref:sulfotransferase family 2 domain-containing protein n=1 Tax=unclassified Candidatus Frackibacter TaxID=2648818 RepID=UPI0008832557|nr:MULTISPECIES: sulfotransferase family 2 domain-containing protein [unclassified Candidatus Frackibacter]SDC82928.1 Sulfotransferase family protein [Candidatus Frackibacter sp. WG11]SEM97409.1 Sulfotransferase family protein [Candidatus Frackibacter sp. WG12]SFM06136.1 Sulfotransferase family protein [Candidatus Frackibacter sp. WG13]
MKDKLLIFMHIPKTGGITLRRIIDKQYDESKVFTGKHKGAIGELEEDRNQFRCVQGHVRFGIHEYCPEPYTYITMIREPVDRMISEYYHIRRSPTNRFHERMQSINLKEYAISNEFASNSNRQVSILTGVKKDPFDLEKADLKEAKRNLDEYFSVVGITERFDESLLLMKRELGWDNILYTKKNVGQNRLPKEEVSNEVLDIIKERNKLDIELYNYAKNNLQEQINSLGPDFKRNLNNFIHQSKEFNNSNH